MNFDKYKRYLRNSRSYHFFFLIYKAYRILSSRAKWRKVRNLDTIRLNIGSGPIHNSPGWITVDLNGAYITHDIRKRIPLGDQSVLQIYSSHVLEHLVYNDIVRVLQECFRLLKNGGEMYIVVPNARLYIEAYMNKSNYVNSESRSIYTRGYNETGSFIDQVNYIAYLGGEHKYLFDEENVINILNQVGFTAKFREYDSKFDSKEHAVYSLHILAVK